MNINIKDILERRFQALSREDEPKAFFLGLADYVGTIKNNESLSELLSDLLAERDLAYKNIENEKQTVLEELRSSGKKLKKQILALKVQDEQINHAFDQIENLEEGHISGVDEAEYTYQEYNIVLHRLIALGHEKIVEEFGTIIDNSGIKQIADQKLSIKFDEYVSHRKDFKSERNFSIWSCWTDLEFVFYTQPKRAKEFIKSLNLDERSMGYLDICGLAGEMSAILEDKAERPTEFKIHEYKTKFNRFHFYFLERILEDQGQDKKIFFNNERVRYGDARYRPTGLRLFLMKECWAKRFRASETASDLANSIIGPSVWIEAGYSDSEVNIAVDSFNKSMQNQGIPLRFRKEGRNLVLSEIS